MIFTFQDQLVFSELSQDFNPMHCNEVLARRLIYGEPVVHGINAMIIALREWSKSSTKMFSINKLR
jgi:acyl dehydratase